MSTPRSTRPVPGRVPQPADSLTPPLFAGRAWIKPVAITVTAIAIVILLMVQPWQPPPAQASCVVAIDWQGSTREMTATYLRWLPGLLSDCATKSRADIIVVPITSETLTGTTQPVSTRLTDLEFSGNTDNDDDRVAEEITRFINEEVAPMTRDAEPQAPGGTDLLSISTVIEPYLADVTTLIVLSDGMHRREPYPLYRIPLGPQDIDAVLTQLQDTGQLGLLNGVQVRMYGVNVGTHTPNQTPERLYNIEQFWRAYYEAAGATVTAYQSTP